MPAYFVASGIYVDGQQIINTGSVANIRAYRIRAQTHANQDRSVQELPRVVSSEKRLDEAEERTPAVCSNAIKYAAYANAKRKPGVS